MTKKINCDKCDKDIINTIRPIYNMQPNGDDTDTHLCSKCFDNYTKWLDERAI